MSEDKDNNRLKDELEKQQSTTTTTTTTTIIDSNICNKEDIISDKWIIYNTKTYIYSIIVTILVTFTITQTIVCNDGHTKVNLVVNFNLFDTKVELISVTKIFYTYKIESIIFIQLSKIISSLFSIIITKQQINSTKSSNTNTYIFKPIVGKDRFIAKEQQFIHTAWHIVVVNVDTQDTIDYTIDNITGTKERVVGFLEEQRVGGKSKVISCGLTTHTTLVISRHLFDSCRRISSLSSREQEASIDSLCAQQVVDTITTHVTTTQYHTVIAQCVICFTLTIDTYTQISVTCFFTIILSKAI
eukprot:gene11010-12831_t